MCDEDDHGYSHVDARACDKRTYLQLGKKSNHREFTTIKKHFGLQSPPGSNDTRMDESPSCVEDVHEQLLIFIFESGIVKYAGVGSFRLRQRYAHTTTVSLNPVFIGIIGPSSEVENPSELLFKGSSTTSKRLRL